MDSCHGVAGRRSAPQSNHGLTTTDRGTSGAESVVESGDTESPQRTDPDTARAYGSNNNLDGSWRSPGRQSFPVDPVAVPGTRPDVGQVSVPHRTGALGQRDPDLLAVLVEQAQVDAARSPGDPPSLAAEPENTLKLVPAPSQVAPSGYGRPGQTRTCAPARITRRHPPRATAACVSVRSRRRACGRASAPTGSRRSGDPSPVRREPSTASRSVAWSTHALWARSSSSWRSKRTRCGRSHAVRTIRSRLDRRSGPTWPRRSTDQAGPSSPSAASVGSARGTMSSQSG